MQLRAFVLDDPDDAGDVSRWDFKVELSSRSLTDGEEDESGERGRLVDDMDVQSTIILL